MRITNKELKKLNALQFETYYLAYQYKKTGMAESKQEFEKRIVHYDGLIHLLLTKYGYDSHAFGIDPHTGKILSNRVIA